MLVSSRDNVIGILQWVVNNLTVSYLLYLMDDGQ